MTHETEANSSRAWTFRGTYTPCIVAAITVLLFAALESGGYNLSKLPWYFPVSWGLPKEIFLDPIALLFLAWNGWVFLFPLLAGLYSKFTTKKLSLLYLSMSLLVGGLDTYISFTEFELRRYLMGMVTYLFVFGVILLLAISLRSLINFSKGRISK